MWGPSPDPWGYSSSCEDLPIDYSCRRTSSMAELTRMSGGKVNLRNPNNLSAILSSNWDTSSRTPTNTSDVTVMTGDLKMFRVHLAVVKSMSPFFAQLLSVNASSLANLVPFNAYQISFLLPDVTEKYFQYALSYMYEGTVTVPRHDWTYFKIYANYFQLQIQSYNDSYDNLYQQRICGYRRLPTAGSYIHPLSLASSLEGPMSTSSPVKVVQSSNITSSPLNVNDLRLHNQKNVHHNSIKEEISDETLEEVPHSVSSINSLTSLSYNMNNFPAPVVGENLFLSSMRLLMYQKLAMMSNNTSISYDDILQRYMADMRNGQLGLNYSESADQRQEPSNLQSSKETGHIDVDNSYVEKTLKRESMDTTSPKDEINRQMRLPETSFGHREDMSNIPLHVNSISPFSVSPSSSTTISPPLSYSDGGSTRNSIDLQCPSNPTSPHQSPSERMGVGKMARKSGEKKVWKSYKQYSTEDLENALHDFKTGKLSIQSAAKLYNIPSRTLYDKVHKYNIKPTSKQKNADEIGSVATAQLDLHVMRSLASETSAALLPPSQTVAQPILRTSTSKPSIQSILPTNTSKHSLQPILSTVTSQAASQPIFSLNSFQRSLQTNDQSVLPTKAPFPENHLLNSNASELLNRFISCRPRTPNSEADLPLALTNQPEHVGILIDPGC